MDEKERKQWVIVTHFLGMIRKILRFSIGSSSKLIPASMLYCNIVKGSAVDIDDLCNDYKLNAVVQFTHLMTSAHSIFQDLTPHPYDLIHPPTRNVFN